MWVYVVLQALLKNSGVVLDLLLVRLEFMKSDIHQLDQKNAGCRVDRQRLCEFEKVVVLLVALLQVQDDGGHELESAHRGLYNLPVQVLEPGGELLFRKLRYHLSDRRNDLFVNVQVELFEHVVLHFDKEVYGHEPFDRLKGKIAPL